MTPVELQTILAQRGFFPGIIDGISGPSTIDAIKHFQLADGLKDDGVVGPITLAALIGSDQPLHQIGTLPATVSSACIDAIKAWESLGDGDPHTVLLDPYFDDVGIATAGWGHAILDDSGQFIRAKFKGDPDALARARAALVRRFGTPAITIDQAKSLLSIDVNQFVGQLAPILGITPTSQAQFDAITCFSFNVGARAFTGSSVLARHRAGIKVSSSVNWSLLSTMSQADKMDSTMEGAYAAWSKAGGHWLLGLFRRRCCEAMLYRGDSIDAALSVARAIT